MVQRLLFTLFLFLLFLLEGTVFQWIVPDVWGMHWTVVPMLTLVVIILLSVYFGSNYGMVYGILFGLLHDLAFGHMLGGYIFSFAVVAYFSGQFMKQFQRQPFLIIVTVMIGISVHMMMAFGFNKLFTVTQMDFKQMVYSLLLPSAVFNVIFAAFLLHPLKRWFFKMGARV